MTADVGELAARLTKAAADRQAIAPLSDEVDLDLRRAYAIQRALRDQAGQILGWKLGLTSKAKQAQMGVGEPLRGFLTPALRLPPGAPLRVGELIQPRAEPEIAFVIGDDLAGPQVSASDVLGATRAVAPAIEIIDSRYRDYRFTLPDVVADNSSAARFAVGTLVSPSGVDLRLIGVVFSLNGELVATAAGGAALGNPAEAVAWLVRSLAVDNDGLHPGQVVLSGSLTAAIPVAAGDVVTVEVDRLGTLELRCQE